MRRTTKCLPICGMRASAFLAHLVFSVLFLVPAAHAFVANASDHALQDPLEAATTMARWNANTRALVDSGERGLGGGLEFSLDSAFCSSLDFVDGSTCDDIRALIVEAGRKWSVGNPRIFLVDVTDRITARQPNNFASYLDLGAEINFFAKSRAEVEAEVERAAASAGTMISDAKPQSTNGTTLFAAEGTITHASIQFTTDNCYYLVTPVAPGVCIPFGLILLHEIGHVLGLGHPDTLSQWNLDSDDDPETPMEIQCRTPLAGLRFSPNYNRDALMVSTQTAIQTWESAITLDDYAGRDFLYPVCTDEEQPDMPSLANSQAAQPALSASFGANFYPIRSLIANEDGRVLLSLNIAPDRSIETVTLYASSGFERLDEAAITILKNSPNVLPSDIENEIEVRSVLAEIVWQLPLRPAFGIGHAASIAEDLELPARLADYPADETLLRVPDESAAAGEQGVVRVRALVSASGNILSTDIVETSGFTALDNAAAGLANASRYESAIHNGVAVEASLEMAFAYDVLPGKPSPRCYPYPIDVGLPVIRMTYFSNMNPAADENPTAKRWVSVSEAGEIETMILATETGWMHIDEMLRQRWEASAAIPENHPARSCWYYRPFLIPEG